jgi:hypothetical protein
MSPARFPEFYDTSGVRLAADGTLPYKTYVIREKGVVEVGNLSCGQCHTRVMPDGTVVKGAQGNFPEGFFFAARPRRALKNGRDPQQLLMAWRNVVKRQYGAPWIQPPPEGEALRTRRGTGYYKIPSLKGVWYRGPFEHNGSVATLEDWFDAQRLKDDYVPTGHIGYGMKTRGNLWFDA